MTPRDPSRATPGARTAERGSATPVVAAACAVVLVLAAAGSAAIGAAVTASRARVAADLAALAGAGSLVAAMGEGAVDPCGSAMVVAARNGAVLTACEVDGSVNVSVEVSVTPSTASSWSLGTGPVVARARAGPRPAKLSRGP